MGPALPGTKRFYFGARTGEAEGLMRNFGLQGAKNKPCLVLSHSQISMGWFQGSSGTCCPSPAASGAGQGSRAKVVSPNSGEFGPISFNSHFDSLSSLRDFESGSRWEKITRMKPERLHPRLPEPGKSLPYGALRAGWLLPDFQRPLSLV